MEKSTRGVANAKLRACARAVCVCAGVLACAEHTLNRERCLSLRVTMFPCVWGKGGVILPLTTTRPAPHRTTCSAWVHAHVRLSMSMAI